MRPFWKHLGVMLLVMSLAAVLCLSLNQWDNQYTRAGTQPENGVLVLSQEEAEEGKAHYLIQDWQFYPGVLLTPESYAQEKDQRTKRLISIGTQPSFDMDSNNWLRGSGTYVLTLKLPMQNNQYALQLPEIYSAYRLYLDDKLLIQMGEPDPARYEDRIQNRMISFSGGTHTLMLAVSDYSHVEGGMVHPPVLGSAVNLNYIRGAHLALPLCVGVMSLIVVFMALHMALRRHYENSLIFALLCFGGTVLSAYPLLHTLFELSVQPWYVIELVSHYGLMLMLVVLLNRLCEIPLLLRYISQGVVAGVCLVALAYGLFGAHLTFSMIVVFSVLSKGMKLMVVAYLMLVAFHALLRDETQMWRLLYAVVFYAQLLIWEVALPSYEAVISTDFSLWGVAVIIFVVCSCLWKELISTYAQQMIFAEEHRQMARQLTMQMEYSEQIRHRTEENRRLIHDFRQHLRTITALSSQVESTESTRAVQQELLQYLEQMPNTSLQRHTPAMGNFCNRAAVDALLQYYNAAALRQGVQATLGLRIPDGVTLSDIEWCSVLGNLLENALEACQRMTGEPKKIAMNTQQIQGMFFVKIENTYDGVYRRKGRGFLSRKTVGTVRTGVGLESVAKIITEHGGTLDIYPKADIFIVGVSIPIVPQ